SCSASRKSAEGMGEKASKTAVAVFILIGGEVPVFKAVFHSKLRFKTGFRTPNHWGKTKGVFTCAKSPYQIRIGITPYLKSGFSGTVSNADELASPSAMFTLSRLRLFSTSSR